MMIHTLYEVVNVTGAVVCSRIVRASDPVAINNKLEIKSFWCIVNPKYSSPKIRASLIC